MSKAIKVFFVLLSDRNDLVICSRFLIHYGHFYLSLIKIKLVCLLLVKTLNYFEALAVKSLMVFGKMVQLENVSRFSFGLFPVFHLL